MSRPPFPALILISSLGLALACGPPPADPSVEAEAEESHVVLTAGELEIQEPRVQLFGEMGAAFFNVHNSGDQDDRLLSVEGGAESVEIHETVTDGSVLRMEARGEGFEIPAGSTLRLEPGGRHVMLVRPHETPEGATTFPLTLVFERGGRVKVDAPLTGFSMPAAAPSAPESASAGGES